MTATWELYWLGISLSRLRHVPTAWLKAHVNAIKTGQRNERIGSLFEILALGLFVDGTQNVSPSKLKQPGFDGSLEFSDATKAVVSLKNFSRSQYQKQFDAATQVTSAAFKRNISDYARQWSGLLAISETYPTSTDWALLNAHIANISSQAIGAMTVVGPWHIRNTGPPAQANLHRAQRSYTLQIIAKHQKNEAKNIEGSLADAFANFDTHVDPSGAGSSNIILIRLGESFSIPHFAAWTQSHFSRRQTKLDEVILYQPAVALDQTTSGVSLTHHMTALSVGSNRHSILNLSIPVGIDAPKPTRNVFSAGNNTFPTDGYHVHQTGEVYVQAEEMNEGVTVPFRMDFGPGVIAHNVTRMLGGPEEIIFSPRHPLSWTLSLMND